MDKSVTIGINLIRPTYAVATKKMSVIGGAMLNNLDKSTILKNLKTDIDLIVLETVASTNTYLQDLKPQVITACLAEKQTSGRGQFERNWQSPSGNIYLSLAYPFTKAKNLTGLSLVAGLAVCDAVEQCCQLNQHLQVKWPNDIIADTKKISWDFN